MSSAAPTQHPGPSLYEEDFYAWTIATASLLRQRRLTEIDLVHVGEVVEDMGKRERRELKSHIRNVTLHLLNWQYQPKKRGSSWRQSIRNGRIEIHQPDTLPIHGRAGTRCGVLAEVIQISK